VRSRDMSVSPNFYFVFPVGIFPHWLFVSLQSGRIIIEQIYNVFKQIHLENVIIQTIG
jgi:hypothetical protein